jgi:RimJ/RimL family protein N-acetyltransferase
MPPPALLFPQTDNIKGAVRLECGKCVVRDWARTDRESLLRHANNRKVWRNLTHEFPHPYTTDDAERWFARLEAAPEPTHWAIEVDGQAVGGVGVMLREGVREKSAAFGYWLGEPYWGRGIMTNVVGKVAPYALARFGLVRLVSPVFAWNPASMRVLEKCQFVREGVARSSIFKDGELIDEVIYARVAA